MVVRRLLYYWEGNFSGTMLNFGRVYIMLFAYVLSEAPPKKNTTNSSQRSCVVVWQAIPQQKVATTELDVQLYNYLMPRYGKHCSISLIKGLELRNIFEIQQRMFQKKIQNQKRSDFIKSLPSWELTYPPKKALLSR